MSKKINRVGKKYNKLTVTEERGKNKWDHIMWLCKCECGNEKIISGNRIGHGRPKSCGCLNHTSEHHGMCGTKEHHSWGDMLYRCRKKSYYKYKDYGGRGIKVCDRWLKFKNFYEDMGKCSKGLTLDRIDNNGNYEPSNCRWATWKQQMNNTRQNHLIKYKGKTQTLTQWSDEIGIRRKTIYLRLKANWSVEKALNTPTKSRSL